MTYGHGDDKYRYGDRIKMNFSSNIYQRADLTELKDYLATRLDAIGNYPEPEPKALESLIAEKLEISADMVMVTNGANEAIYLIAQLYRHWASVIPQPTYNEYADACRMFGHTISYDRNDELNILPEDRIYWLCNPDNPTGNVLLKSLITHIIRKHPRYLYVIDQSYADSVALKEILCPRSATWLSDGFTYYYRSSARYPSALDGECPCHRGRKMADRERSENAARPEGISG